MEKDLISFGFFFYFFFCSVLFVCFFRFCVVRSSFVSMRE